MQDVYAIITEAMLQALKDQVIYRQQAYAYMAQEEYISEEAVTDSLSWKEGLSDGRGSDHHAHTYPNCDASSEALHVLS